MRLRGYILILSPIWGFLFIIINCNVQPANPLLEGNPPHPDQVALRRQQFQDYSGNAFDPKEVANELGYTTRIPSQKASFNSHGQTVFSDGNRYISRDVDSHNVTSGWKMFNAKGDRIGTYSSDLTIRIKD